MMSFSEAKRKLIEVACIKAQESIDCKEAWVRGSLLFIENTHGGLNIHCKVSITSQTGMVNDESDWRRTFQLSGSITTKYRIDIGAPMYHEAKMVQDRLMPFDLD